MQKDFENEVAKRSEEIGARRERDAVQKYKSLYERERRELEQRLKRDFDESIKAVKAELDTERAEVARLKSLELLRLRKLGEQKKDLY